VIARRLLVNYRVDPGAVEGWLPSPFRPKLQRGHAIAGICLIRLTQLRPGWLPGWCGVTNENAAYRVAVTWDDETGRAREGVYIPRRVTGSRIVHLCGGRVFSGEHHWAEFSVQEEGSRLSLSLRDADRQMQFRIRGAEDSSLPAGSCFRSADEASSFFANGQFGYSPSRDPYRLDCLRLVIRDWNVRPFHVEDIESRFFADPQRFPAGSAVFDHALIMRNVEHSWEQSSSVLIGAGRDGKAARRNWSAQPAHEVV
jgi:hypothetical protein